MGGIELKSDSTASQPNNLSAASVPHMHRVAHNRKSSALPALQSSRVKPGEFTLARLACEVTAWPRLVIGESD